MKTQSLGHYLLNQMGIKPKVEVEQKVSAPKPEKRQFLSPNQALVFFFLKDFIKENQYPPTRQEIATHFGYKSPNAAEEHLKALERKKVILLVKGTSRGIRIL